MTNGIITNIIQDAEQKGFTCFGIRHHHEVVKVGDELGVSYNTIDDCDPEKLSGICCLQTTYDGFEVEDWDYDVREVTEAGYQDGSIILVGGFGFEYGNDPSEIIIEDAVVLWVQK